MIKILFWNIEHFSTRTLERPKSIASLYFQNVLKKAQPDVVTLQEVQVGTAAKPDKVELGEVLPEGSDALSELQRLFLWTRADTIYAGTNEIQRNIIGERALGLPREPKVAEGSKR